MTMSDAIDLETQMNPRAAVPDFQAYLDNAATRSLAVRRGLPCVLDVRYGDGPLQTLDVFSARGKDLPVHVFIHGGFWRGLDKDIYSEIAQPIVASGAIAILVNYDLCPAVTLDDIVQQILACVAWIYQQAPRYGGDPDRISLSGHSAGAHLAAMTLCHDWDSEGLPMDLIKAVVLISGIYDLASVPRLSVNEEIQLTEDQARRNSVMSAEPRVRCRAFVTAGAKEPQLWVRQSSDYAQRLTRAGLVTRYLELPDEHHFSITDRLAQAEHPLTKAMLDMIVSPPS
jgi:arylformamidase